jgi:predicted TIM-barrel fold metal-dependent hydrolase
MTVHLFDEPKIDAHCHLFDPARFPYAADVSYRPAGPEIAPLEQYHQVMAAYGIRQALLVGPNSGYHLDNRCLLDGLARSGGRLKGIAVVPDDADAAQLRTLQAAGVIGIAWNATLWGTERCLRAEPLLRRLADLDLLLSLQVEHDQMLALAPMLRRQGVRVLIDHAGRPDVAAGPAQPGFQALLALADLPHVAVKLSGCQKFSQQLPPFDDTLPYLRALIDRFTLDRCLWASDWPFLKAPQRLDMGPLLRTVERLLPQAADRRRLWWDTPCRWLGFDPAASAP